MATITPQGITGQTLQNYLQRFQNGLLEIDPTWNINPESPDGQSSGIWAETFALLDENVQYAYMSRDPSSAQGQALDDIGTYSGITRKDATFSTAQVTVNGVNGALIPQGYRIRHATTGTTWALDAEVVISGPTNAFVTCTQRGPIEASSGTLTIIGDPVAGWQSVTNADPAVQGQPVESDDVYRLRRNRSVALPGSNQVDNIFSVVANLDGVIQARVYENPENATDVNGLEPHSIAVFVQGGEQDAIFEAIATKKNPGCAMNAASGFPNTLSQNVVTPERSRVPVTFFRPDIVPVFVEVNIESETLGESAKDTIKQAIVEFSQRGYSGDGGFSKRGFQIGEIANSGRLYTPVNNIVGDQGFTASIYVGTDAEPSGLTVPIAFNELSVFDVANIEVNYV